MLHKMKYTLLITLGQLMLSGFIYADPNFNHGFDEGVQTATSLQGKSSVALQNFKPEKYINQYSTNPKESDYLNKPDQLKSDGSFAQTNSSIGKTVSTGMDDRKSQFNYSIDPSSPAIQAIQKRGDAAYDVITGQFGDCTKQTSCTTNYENKTCEETPKAINQYCRKTLNIDLIPHQVDTHYSLTANLTVSDHNYAGVNLSTVTGQIGFLGPHDARFQLSGRLPSNIDCHSLSGRIASSQMHAKLDYINFPSCGNGLVLDFHISGGHSVILNIDIVSSKIVYDTKDNWQDDCSVFENTKSCSLTEEHCVSGAATKTFQGIPVTRSCWEYQDSFLCGAGSDTNTCQTYRNQGCEQIGSVCENHNDSGCTLYQQSFRCPSKQCTDVGTICNGQTYCLSGDCVKQQKQADPDFQKGVTGISVVNAAAKNYNAASGDQFPIFSGQVKSCNKDFLNFADCCSEDGWGVDLHLAQCDQEAKDLGDAKEKKLTVYIDSDDDCILGVCSHKKRYCVFPSKLARIIQESGRRDQLHVSFGNFDHPDCRGLTPAELGSLNFNQINFSEIYADITKNASVEDSGKLNQRVDSKVQEWAKEKTPHG